MLDQLKILGLVATAATGSIGWVYGNFTPSEEYHRHVAESNRGYVLDIVEQARGESPGAFKDSLCRALDEALAALCADAPDDAICKDRDNYRERAGC